MQKHMLSAALAASLLCAGGVASAQNAPASSYDGSVVASEQD